MVPACLILAVGAVLSTRVETSAGPVQGSVNATTITYLGIPYAEAPVGDLRWRPPQPRRPWQTVLEATRFGDHCVQPPPGSSRSKQSEDCLFLNIYVPRKSLRGASHGLKRRPVIVWIPGGGNDVGAADLYDPTPLVETGEGVVVVTLNYRLGVLGFLAHPALDAEGHTAVNYGILDQQLALQWVRTNIERFGGDAGNVTIMGESAGGLNVATHLASPLSAGLFQRAIIHSAYGLDTPSLAASEALGMAFADRVGCAEQTAACLRALSTEKILAGIGEPATPSRAYNAATVDGRILVETQRAAFESGRFNRTPVLQGNNSEEGRAFTSRTLTIAQHEKTLAAALEKIARDPARALAVYSLEHYSTAYEAASAAASDRVACSALESNRLLSKWTLTYAYEFADAAAGPFGAAHGAELKYLFDVNYESAKPVIVTAVTGSPSTLPAASQRLAREMQASWTNFARSGNPEAFTLRRWPVASKGIQLLKPSFPGAISNPQFSARHHCSLWN